MRMGWRWRWWWCYAAARTAFFDGADFFLSSLSLSLSFWKVLLLLLPVVRLFCPFFGLRRGGEGMGVTPSFLAKKIIM